MIPVKRLSLCGSLLSSGSLGSSLSSGGGSSSLLLSHLLGDGLIHLLLCFKSLLGGINLGLLLSLGHLLQALLLVGLPCIELALSSSLVEGTLCYATLEVLHQVHTFAAQNVTYSISGLCAYLYPVQCTVEIQVYRGRIGVRIVRTNLLSETTITWCTSVGDDDAVESIAFTTTALQSDFCCHFLILALMLNCNFVPLTRNSGCKITKKLAVKGSEPFLNWWKLTFFMQNLKKTPFAQRLTANFFVILAFEMKKNSLSIVIPVYNGDCREMVAELRRQAEAIAGLTYEILVIDDASPNHEMVGHGWEVGHWPHCRFMALEQNIGRARIRNLLATRARNEWLLYLDGDMAVFRPDFLLTYLDCDGDVIYGGYQVGKADDSCLRYIYEKSTEHHHTAEQRQKRPYQHFHTSNFMVRRQVMLAHRFDESFLTYGYEDVLLGKQFKQAGISITHIPNPAGFFTFEDNAHFVSKTEEGLRTLYEKRDLLRGYSQMITFVEGIHLGLVKWSIRLWHWLFGRLERHNLCGRKPSLRVFKLYKLGYYLTLSA